MKVLSVVIVVAVKDSENDGFFDDVLEVLLANENEVVHLTSSKRKRRERAIKAEFSRAY